MLAACECKDNKDNSSRGGIIFSPPRHVIFYEYFNFYISQTRWAEKVQEPELISKLKQGSNRAFRTLVKAHKDQVYNTCLGFLRNHEDAEDMAQEVFVEVYHSIDSFRADASLRTWLYRIAVNKSLELIRYRERKKRWGFFKGLMNTAVDIDKVEDRQSFDHPGIVLENKERAQILMEAISRLPEQQKVAFTLHKIEGLPYKEIAGVMEKSLPAVESLMHRAKNNLQDDLYEYYKSDNLTRKGT